jgi:hypothetical protein
MSRFNNNAAFRRAPASLSVSASPARGRGCRCSPKLNPSDEPATLDSWLSKTFKKATGTNLSSAIGPIASVVGTAIAPGIGTVIGGVVGQIASGGGIGLPGGGGSSGGGSNAGHSILPVINTAPAVNTGPVPHRTAGVPFTDAELVAMGLRSGFRLPAGYAPLHPGRGNAYTPHELRVIQNKGGLSQGNISSARQPSPPAVQKAGMSTVTKFAIGGGLAVAAFMLFSRR